MSLFNMDWLAWRSLLLLVTAVLKRLERSSGLWCGHCKKLAPEYEKLAASFGKAKSVLIGKVDCDEHKDVCQKYGVSGYPTIQWFPKGSLEPKKYESARTAEVLTEFVNSEAGTDVKIASIPSSVVVLSSDNFDETKDILVEFNAPWCGHRKSLAPKTELKVVSIHDEKSRTKVMKAITKLQGVDEVSMDKEKKTITIKGDVDPVKVVKQIRKTGHNVEIISVGPPTQPEPPKPPPEPPKPPTKDAKEKPPPPPSSLPPHFPPLPCYCNQCQLVTIAYAPPYEERDACSIL